ncbi:hypothetical protein HanXRQr2_Chr12g0549611 [Helianthus annuus]|uniref:Putative TPX2 (Targeting protein for Xklp2) protein family n=1 Tax=Helianthus annuus TaxID=4232 RepID=A0A251S9Q5_HELAN|nr:protein WVD2-like 7 [Helianthus annuus]KAF5778619.1 hypothetical protein HanXRQr2_Chr12g0549611 [Helianthus annuus]KAJ0494048.1 hypothetical protein HanIR_Chr12g0592971 [Helianthus annuus]KAJ0863365.1 hypothetical protein HanPSC8_Chr12g0529141 [Helianthus annuus]
MAGEIEEPFRLNFQADLLRSGSISFGRFESESLSWERRSVFSHNRYLEEVEKYSKPGSVTEKKAYFEAEFRRKALLKQRLSECQDGGELCTDGNGDLREFEEYGNCDESPCSSSNPSKCNTETEVQHHENGDVACFDEDTTISQRSESQSYEFHCVTTQDEFGETHQSENENVAGNTEQSIGLTLIDHVVPVDVSSEARGDSSVACQIPEKDHDSISSAPIATTTISPKVKPAAEKKLTRSTLKTQVNVDRSQKKVPNGASKGSMKPRPASPSIVTKEKKLPQPASPSIVTKTEKKLPRPASPSIVTKTEKKLPRPASPSIVTKTEKKLPRPASPSIGSRLKTSKAEDLRSEKAVKVKAQRPLSEKSLPGIRPIVNRSKQSVNPSKAHIVQSATGFCFKTDQRAENRKEFYTKIAEKIHVKEVEISQVKAKTLEKQVAEMKQFRKSLNFKAKPLPSFYNESARASDQHKATPISKTPNQRRPSSSMATRHDKNLFKSSVPLNNRPGSSTSATNRIRVSETVVRNYVPEKKDEEGKGTKLNKPKDPEPRGRDMVRRYVKGSHTWNGPKVGVAS